VSAGEIAPPGGKTGPPRIGIELPGGGRALFTDRSHGNMSSVGGRGAEGGLAARERLRERCGIAALVRGYQVHGKVVGRVYADGKRFARPRIEAIAGGGTTEGAGAGESIEARTGREAPAQARVAQVDDLAEDVRALTDGREQPAFVADGHASAAEGVAAMVLAADCLPVVLGAQGAVAAVHAGWRGLVAGVLEEGVRALREVGGSGEVVAVLGPCAGPCCYEVGEEVHAAFRGAHREGRLIDLRAIASDRLLAAGVAEVRDVVACTICDERYFSHRREGERAGRQAAVAWLS
jgi:YfiH family protein